jgi:hypothetical protein
MQERPNKRWIDRELRCILVAQKIPAGYIVQVSDKGSPIAYERCQSFDEATEHAERFRKMFVDG